MKTTSLSLLALSTMLLAAFSNPVGAAEPGDEFDGLYGKRIDLFTKQLDIYESVTDQASAAEAAKKWSALLPLEKEIVQLADKLGQPDEKRLAELNEKYGKRLNEVSNLTLKAGYGLADKPYMKALSIAQLENLAEVKDSEAIRQELKVMKGDPKAVADLEAKRKAASEKRAAIKTDPSSDESFKDYLAATRELTALLDGVKDEAGAKEAAPKALEQVEKWEAKGKLFSDLPAAGNTVQKLDAEVKTDMGALVMTVVKLNGNKPLSEPLKEVLQRIMKVLGG
jgi:DNA repair ATPase RecN